MIQYDLDLYELNKEAITTKLDMCHQNDWIKENFDIIPIKGDGNCIYYCLEKVSKLGLLGEDNKNKTYRNFRKEAYTIISNDSEKYSNFINDDVKAAYID